MNKIFNNLEEVTTEILKIAPVVYKYRDWGVEYDKKILRENKMWLAHPKKLDDPYDIRVPVIYDIDEIKHPLFIAKIEQAIKRIYPNAIPESEEFKKIVTEKIKEIEANPDAYFEKTIREAYDSNIFDCVGILSLSLAPLDEKMWYEYGAKQTGFCIGFNTLKLLETKELNQQFGLVKYIKRPIKHSFINDVSITDENTMLLKHEKWTYQAEFRFINIDINSDSDRLINFDRQTIKEIILGSEISEAYEIEIKEVLREKYNSTVELYKIDRNVSSYAYKKSKIEY